MPPCTSYTGMAVSAECAMAAATFLQQKKKRLCVVEVFIYGTVQNVRDAVIGIFVVLLIFFGILKQSFNYLKNCYELRVYHAETMC